MGPIFDAIRRDRSAFERVQVEAGALVWPNGADLCPDVVIWNGPPPGGESAVGARSSDLVRNAGP